MGVVPKKKAMMSPSTRFFCLVVLFSVRRHRRGAGESRRVTCRERRKADSTGWDRIVRASVRRIFIVGSRIVVKRDSIQNIHFRGEQSVHSRYESSEPWTFR